MVIKEFNNLEEIQKYYDEATSTYVFKEDGKYIDTVKFNFDLVVDANIIACDIIALHIICGNITAWDIEAHNIQSLDINACNITANDIDAGNINAYNIDANDINSWGIKANHISYWAVCFAYNNIKCKSIGGKQRNHKHFVLDGKLEVGEDQ